MEGLTLVKNVQKIKTAKCGLMFDRAAFGGKSLKIVHSVGKSTQGIPCLA